MKLHIRHGFNHIITWLIVVVLLSFACSEQYAGDFCILQRTNATGQCKSFYDCPTAKEDLQSQGIFPQTCGFEGSIPIVCCVENSSFIAPSSIEVGTKSQQKCKEYSDEYRSKIAYYKLPGFEHALLEECVHSHGFLIQGSKARPKEFPYMAAIGYDGEGTKKLWLCSGALISKEFILTAGHCLHHPKYNEPKYIRIGDLILDSDTDDARPQEFNIVQTFKPSNFKPPSLYNDIALLKMDKAAKFSSYARPACLDTNQILSPQQPEVIGWGTHLLKETVKLVSRDKCQDSHKNLSSGKRLKNGISEATQICVGLSRNQDECVLGTGMLQIPNEEDHCMYNIVGVTSIAKACINADVPDVFTRVSAYIEWIEGIVWPS